VSLDTISQFLSAIDRAGELARISEPVKARLELCEIADRVMKQPGGGKALYFENVILDNGQRSRYPAVINLFVKMLGNLYRLFMEKDAALVEINPLIITKEKTLIALDGKVSFLGRLITNPIGLVGKAVDLIRQTESNDVGVIIDALDSVVH